MWRGRPRVTHESCGKMGGGEATTGTTAKSETSVPHVMSRAGWAKGLTMSPPPFWFIFHLKPQDSFWGLSDCHFISVYLEQWSLIDRNGCIKKTLWEVGSLGSSLGDRCISLFPVTVRICKTACVKGTVHPKIKWSTLIMVHLYDFVFQFEKHNTYDEGEWGLGLSKDKVSPGYDDDPF